MLMDSFHHPFLVPFHLLFVKGEDELSRSFMARYVGRLVFRDITGELCIRIVALLYKC